MKNKLKIAEPCQEDWSEMTKTDKGKHCAVCTKQVVDFSENSKEEIITYLNEVEGETCGRFKKGQIAVYGEKQRAIKKTIIPLYKTIATSILAVLGAGFPALMAQDGEYFEMGEVAYDPIEDVVTNNSKITVQGKISSRNQLVENAKVSIYTGGKLIRSILTKVDGKYVFGIGKGTLANNRFTVKVFAAELETKTIENIETTKTEITIDVSMEHEMMVMGKFTIQPEVIKEQNPVIEKQKIQVDTEEIKIYQGNAYGLKKEGEQGNNSPDTIAHPMKSVALVGSVFSSTETSKPGGMENDLRDLKVDEGNVLAEQLRAIEVIVYPNPSADQVFVRTNKKGIYKYGVINLNGKLVFSGTKKGESFELNFAGKPNGMYFISVYQNGLVIKTKRIVISH